MHVSCPTLRAGSTVFTEPTVRRAFVVAVVGVALLAIVMTCRSAVASTQPGTNGKIAFFDGDGSAFTVNPNGSDAHQVGASGGTICPAWSPDGGTILCDVFGDNGPQPATANPDGSDFTLLNPGLQLDLYCGSWSPTGARLLCHSEGIANPSDAGVYTARSSNGGDLKRVVATPDGYFDFLFEYSSDGSRILFNRVSLATGNGALFAVNTDGSHLLRLSPPPLSVVDLDFFDAVSADSSPDGSRVAFAAVWKSGQGRGTALYEVNVDGTGVQQLTPSGLGALSAQWSPNGRMIAITSKRLGDQQVWIVHPNGTGLREVTFPMGGSISFAPVWSPNSSRLLFQTAASRGQDADQLQIINTDGSGRRHLTTVVGNTQYTWGTAPTG